MKQIEPTHTLTIDKEVFVVAMLPQPIQDMISLLDDWRQRENELTSDLTMVKSALTDVKNRIYVTIKELKKEVQEDKQTTKENEE